MTQSQLIPAKWEKRAGTARRLAETLPQKDANMLKAFAAECEARAAYLSELLGIIERLARRVEGLDASDRSGREVTESIRLDMTLVSHSVETRVQG